MVLSVINKHMPFKTKRMKKKYSPWLSVKIFKLMKERDNAKKKAIASKNERLWKEYRLLRNTVISLLRKTKRQYHVDKLSVCTNRNQS